MPGRDVDTAIRIVHDLTQSVWLGGALMGAVSLDAAASSATDEEGRVAGLDRAWSRWHRISTPAILAHLAAGTGLVIANKGRLTSQSGAARTTALRTALTGVALVTELRTRALGRRIGAAAHAAAVDAEGPDGDGTGDEETGGGAPDLAQLQRELTVAQWANVAATAAMVAVGARMGEQQRPRELLRGVASRLGLAA